MKDCPGWCIANHRSDERAHRSEALVVSAIQAGADPEAGRLAPDLGTGAELTMELRQERDGVIAWVYLGDGTNQYLDLSAESFHRVLHLGLLWLRQLQAR